MLAFAGVNAGSVNLSRTTGADATERSPAGTLSDGATAPTDGSLATHPAAGVRLPTGRATRGVERLTCPLLTEQRHFLAAMGIEPRVNALMQAAPDGAARRAIFEGASRLVAAPGMGSAYKALAIAHPRLGPDIPGFARCTN